MILVGDARPLMATMPDGAFDAVITDIPYNTVNRPIGAGFDKVRTLDKGTADSAPVSARGAVRDFARLARGSVYVWCAQEQLSTILRTMQRVGMTTRTLLWEKSDPSPMNGQYLWLSGVEVCAFGRWPSAYFGRFCANTVLRGPTERGIDWHPTPKPVWLMRELVTASVPPGGSVLDPYCGSGSVGVACAEQGREFTGIEIDPGWAERASRRVGAAQLGLFHEGAA